MNVHYRAVIGERTRKPIALTKPRLPPRQIGMNDKSNGPNRSPISSNAGQTGCTQRRWRRYPVSLHNPHRSVYLLRLLLMDANTHPAWKTAPFRVTRLDCPPRALIRSRSMDSRSSRRAR